MHFKRIARISLHSTKTNDKYVDGPSIRFFASLREILLRNSFDERKKEKRKTVCGRSNVILLMSEEERNKSFNVQI
jgi:hypothetical protein